MKQQNESYHPQPRIKIITDSASDIPVGDATALGIDIIPIPITIDGQGYFESVDFTPREFYTILQNSKEIPSTSQISPVTYCEYYHKVLQEGYTDIILVSFSSTASSTYQRAIDARILFLQNPEAIGKINIHIMDSKMFSQAYGYAVMEAAKMVREGKNVQEIMDYLQYWFDHVEAYFTAFSFEYIKKSGRIGCASAIVGEALGIRPLIQIKKGEMKMVAKVRGNHAVMSKLCDILSQRIAPDSPFVMLNGTFPGAQEELAQLIQEATGKAPAGIFDVGASVSINSGPQMIGIGFLTTDDTPAYK